MGTVGEWVEVFFIGALWSAFMAWMSLPIESEHRRKVRYLAIQAGAVGGLGFGLVTTFGLQSLRLPLVALLAPTLVLAALMGKHYRNEMAKLKNEDSTQQG